jgi:hypothetical protein
MANTKPYVVIKDGETLKELKTLAAARKLADAEGAEVFCEGECVYQGTVDPVTPAVEETAVEEAVVETAEEATEPSAKVESVFILDEQGLSRIMSRLKKHPVSFCLLRKMNVRKEPSLSAEVLRVLKRGTDIVVKDIRNDWLCLTDGSFILFENGKNAFPMK